MGLALPLLLVQGELEWFSLNQAAEDGAYVIGAGGFRIQAKHHPGSDVLQRLSAVDHRWLVGKIAFVETDIDEPPVEVQPVDICIEVYRVAGYRQLKVAVFSVLPPSCTGSASAPAA